MTTVITNGVFDLLHDGHKHLLKYAAYIAGEHDTVYVLININKSVRRIKGSSRPIQSLRQRIKQIEDFIKHTHPCFISHYVILPFDTEEEIVDHIKRWNICILLKGNDRTDVTKITGSDLCPVCIIPRLKDKNGKDISTTEQIRMHQSE